MLNKLHTAVKQLLSSKKAQAGLAPEDIDVPGITNEQRKKWLDKIEEFKKALDKPLKGEGKNRDEFAHERNLMKDEEWRAGLSGKFKEQVEEGDRLAEEWRKSEAEKQMQKLDKKGGGELDEFAHERSLMEKEQKEQEKNRGKKKEEPGSDDVEVDERKKRESVGSKVLALVVKLFAFAWSLVVGGGAKNPAPTGSWILFSIVVWLLGLGLSFAGQAPFYMDLFFIILFIRSNRIDGLFLLAVIFEIGSSFQGAANNLVFSDYLGYALPDFLKNVLFNPAMPWWPLYTIIRNGGKGKIGLFFYALTVVLLAGLLFSNLINVPIVVFGNDLSGQIDREQIATARALGEKAYKGVGETAMFLVRKTVGGVSGGIGGFINPQIASAGGAELLGEPKERPKLGLVINEHPRGYTTFEEGGVEKAVVKAILLIPNPVEGNFLEVTDVECSANNRKIVVRPFEFSEDGMKFDGPVRIFYNSPTTVSCIFDKKEVEKLSSVELSVKYRFEENAKLITYLMRDDLLAELKISGEDPLDFMAVPSGKRRPSTVYDNGPAKIGIGPQELLQPPVGVPAGRKQFELVIVNAPDFNGRISSIDAVSVVLPKGVNLVDKCFLKKSGESTYALSSSFIKDNKKALENIKPSRLFICGMNITKDSLSGASFAEVEFDVNMNFIYETKKTLRLKE